MPTPFKGNRLKKEKPREKRHSASSRDISPSYLMSLETEKPLHLEGGSMIRHIFDALPLL